MKVFVQSLGCDKNLSDTEHMLSNLMKSGYEITDDETAADIVIVNTCCFIHDALEESINSVIDLGRLKEEGNVKALIVTGCMAERYTDEIKTDLPEVDGVIGTSSYDRVPEIITEILQKKGYSVSEGNPSQNAPISEQKNENSDGPIVLKDNLSRLPDEAEGRVRTNPIPYAYLKIAEGCNKMCAYCVIPYVRGPYRSVPMESLVKEAEELAADGIKELILVAQETTLYGTDLYKKKCLPELINRLSDINGIEAIRILYAYPEELTKDVVDVIRWNKKVLHYIDIPIQHASNKILKSMGRKTTKEDLLEGIRKMRGIIPDIAIRTTVMVGFPGETEADFEELKSFIKEVKFDHLGAFTYSREEGTRAYSFENQVDEETAQRRYDEIMSIQKEISLKKNKSLIGKTFSAMVEGYIPEDGVLSARIYRDAPGVDGTLFIESDREYISGTILKVRITKVNEYDYKGELVS